MWHLVIGLFLLLSPCFLQADSLPAPQQDELSQLTSLSQQVKLALQESKQQTQLLQNNLDLLQQRLTLSEQQLTVSKTELTELYTSLNNTKTSFNSLSEAYDKSNLQLELEKQKVRARNKVLLVIGIIGAAITLMKVAAFILYARGVHTPRWLDIVL